MADEMKTASAPRVSVIMSLYNSEKFLTEAIESVLAQTFSDFESIIIDDGSKDSSADIVESYQDSRIRLFHQKNSGLPAALNRAITEARSDIIARMDPDDVCLPGRLASQYEYLIEHPEVALVGSGATCVDEFGETLTHITMTPLFSSGEVSLPESPCIHPSVMFRRSAYEKAGGYPEIMRYGGEDAVLFNRILISGAVANLPEPLIMYRLSHTSMSHKSRRFNRLLRQLIRKEVFSEQVDEKELQQLSQEYRRSGSGRFGYQLYVGKLFLNSDDREEKARDYLINALKESPFSLHAWLCLLSSYMPFRWRLSLRSFLKRNT